MNQIFLGQPVDAIKTWFTTQFPSWPTYTTLKFKNGTTQTKEINGVATQENIGSNDIFDTLTYCQLGKNVTSIRSFAFYNCSSLTSINIPSSVTSIGENAFLNCYSLTSVDLPNSVALILYNTFSDCSSLPSIDIPSSVTKIENNAFQNCTSLSSITIPNSVTSIGDYTFSGCSSLTSVIFENRTLDKITALSNYPWDIPNTSAIKPGIS